MSGRVLLVGCSGSGRTTVGGLVSGRLRWPFLDDDALLERTTGTDVATLWTRDGEEAVAAAEQATLTLLLGVPGPLIATVASTVLLQEAGRERVRSGGHVVHLRASLPTLLRRVGKGAGRPWLGSDPTAALRRLLEERGPLYEQVADQVVDVDLLPAGQVARAVVEGLPPELRS